MAADPAERLARDQNFFRQVNERIREIAGEHGSLEQEYLCECSDPACTGRISLTLGEYESIRSHPVRFVLVPGHRAGALERDPV